MDYMQPQQVNPTVMWNALRLNNVLSQGPAQTGSLLFNPLFKLCLLSKLSELLRIKLVLQAGQEVRLGWLRQLQRWLAAL